MSNPDKEEFRQINRSWCFRSAPHWQYFNTTTRQGLCCNGRCDSARWQAKSLLKALLRNTNDLRSTHLKAAPEYNELENPQKQQFLEQPRVQKSSRLIQKIPIFEAEPGFFWFQKAKRTACCLTKGQLSFRSLLKRIVRKLSESRSKSHQQGDFLVNLREKITTDAKIKAWTEKSLLKLLKTLLQKQVCSRT